MHSVGSWGFVGGLWGLGGFFSAVGGFKFFQGGLCESLWSSGWWSCGGGFSPLPFGGMCSGNGFFSPSSTEVGGLCFGGGFGPLGGALPSMEDDSNRRCPGWWSCGGLCSGGGFSPLPFGGLFSGNGFSSLSSGVGGLCFGGALYALNIHVKFCINQILFIIWSISLYFIHNFKL